MRLMVKTTPSQRRAFLALCVVVLILSAAMRLMTFRRHLPFTDYSDESNFYMLALDWRGNELSKLYGTHLIGEWLGSYPPLYIWMNMGVQQILEASWGKGWIPVGGYIAVLRLIAVLGGILTTALIMAIGYRIAGPIAGGMAGLVWSLTPVIIETNNLAIPDGLVYPSATGALLMAIWAWQKKSPLWTVGSLLAAIAAIYAKYIPVYALIPWAIITFLLARRNLRKMLPWLVLEAAIALVTASYLIYSLSTVCLQNQEADWTRTEGFQRMLDVARNLNNWQYAIQPIGVSLLTIVLVGGIFAYLISRRCGWRTVNLWWIAFILISTLPAVPISAQISNLSGKTGKIRFVLTTTIGMAIVWGAALAQIVFTLYDWQQSGSTRLIPAAFRPIRAISIVLLGVIVVVWGQPALAVNLRVAQAYTLPHTIVVFWRWMDANVPPDGLILAQPQSPVGVTWNRPWSGYDGSTSFQWWLEPINGGQTLQQYIERGIRYFALDQTELKEFQTDPVRRAFLDQLMLIKTIPAGPNVIGDTIYLYRLLPPQVSTDVVFGQQISLKGYDLNISTDPSGKKSIDFQPYWQSLRRPDNNYSVFAHLYAEGSDQLLTQFDGPASTDRSLTLTWDDIHELHFGPAMSLSLPADLPAGNYVLQLGLYDSATGQRLLTDQGTDHYLIKITP
jgi:hypothetical protein